MKTWLAGFLAHYAQTTTKLARYWRVERQDALTFGWLEHDQDITIDGLTYRASEGLQVSTVENTDGFAVSSMDVTAFLDVSTEAEIEAGIWEESVVTLFEARWDVPPTTFDVENLNVLRYGVLGRIDRENLKFMAEVRGLSSRLDTRIGRVYTATCPWRHAVWNGTTFVADTVCGVSLAGIVWDGLVTAVDADQPHMNFTTNLTPPAGYFNAGVLAMTTGPNAGLGKLSSMDVRRFENGTIYLHRPLPYPVAIGNWVRVVQGDDKTFDTCRNTYSNYQHFGGYPHVVGMDKVLNDPLVVIPCPDPPRPPDGNPANDPHVVDEGD